MSLREDLELLAMDRRSFSRTLQALDQALEDHVFPGAVVGVWIKRRSEFLFAHAVGNRRILPTPEPCFLDTVFDLASLTKVYSTVALAGRLMDRGWLNPDSPVGRYFPGYPHSNVLVKHLLSHTAGYEAWEPFFEEMVKTYGAEHLPQVSISTRQKWMRDRVLRLPLQYRPGERCVYSDVSFLILGFLLEEILEMPLDQAVDHHVWDPLGAKASSFVRTDRPPRELQDEKVAATENCLWRGLILQGQVHDDNCWAMGGYAGHAGAFSNVEDLLHFIRGLHHGFLSDETLRFLWSKVQSPVESVRTYGWDGVSAEKSSAGKYFSAGSVGHLGYTGTSLWIDREASLGIVLLSNRVHPSRENEKIKVFRPLFHDAIREDLATISL